MESDGRKHPAHFPATERFNTPIVIFLTVCTKDRKRILANDSAHNALQEAWRQQPSWLVGRYIVMPDHVHLFCAPGESPVVPLERWVRFWKSYAAQHWPSKEDAPVWQRHFWDTQLRRGESYTEKWQYVVQNAVRAGLVNDETDWSYQGELNVLRW
jgi:REP element-mobilizing transposase RayT